MALQNLQKRPLADPALVEQGVGDMMVHEGRAAFVHHLGLLLGIEVLGNGAHDA